MKTLTVEIKQDIALSFLRNMESMQIISIVNPTKKCSNKKLSDRFRGCLSDDKVDALQNELVEMRKEWERNI